MRDGNFPLVVLDLVLNASAELRKIPQTSWYRLQRLVEAAPTAFLVLTRESIISSAQLKLSLDNAWTLADLEQNHLTARLQILVKRTQGGREAHRGSELMFATIYLPNFYLQAALRHQPELSGKPVALIDDREKKALIIQLNAAAEQTGVRCGMTPSQGLARCLQLVVKTRILSQEKLLTGNPAAFCRHARALCGSNRRRYFDGPIYGRKKSDAEDGARDRTISGR